MDILVIDDEEIKPEILVVMMDSYPDHLLEEAQKRGAGTCIHKPFDIKDVKEVISVRGKE